jgi:transposase-like protein
MELTQSEKRLTIERIALAYGVSQMTIYEWIKCRGVVLQDFATPRTVVEKLRKTASRNSPRLTLLEKIQTQLAIIFRLSI